jgi:hypothetical protein
MPRVVLALFVALSLHGCVAYEFEHEFWIRADGSGSVNVTARPELWAAMKGLRGLSSMDEEGSLRALRSLFESSGLRVRRVTLTHRAGRPYLFVAADFADVNRLAGTPAFPDLTLTLHPASADATSEANGGAASLRLDGRWARPPGLPDPPPAERDGLMAVRFHLPSKVYSHRNAFAGVERGNIVGWRETITEGIAGRPLDVGVVMDRRSILLSTVSLFAGAIAVAAILFAGIVSWVVRSGRRSRAGTS